MAAPYAELPEKHYAGIDNDSSQEEVAKKEHCQVGCFFHEVAESTFPAVEYICEEIEEKKQAGHDIEDRDCDPGLLVTAVFQRAKDRCQKAEYRFKQQKSDMHRQNIYQSDGPSFLAMITKT